MVVCGFLLLGEALEFCGVCCLYSLYLSPTNVSLWSQYKNITPGHENHSVLGWLLRGCHSSPCCFQWQIDLVLLSTSAQAHGLCSQISTALFLTFLKENDKSLEMLLETYMGTLGTKTLLPQSQWNLWRSLKSSINHSFLKPCQNCKVSFKEGSVNGNMEQHWLEQFSTWECTCPCKRTGALSGVQFPGYTGASCGPVLKGNFVFWKLCFDFMWKMHCDWCFEWFLST